MTTTSIQAIEAIYNDKKQVKVSHPHCYPAWFFIRHGELFSFSRTIGTFRRDELTRERLQAHFERMIEEGGKLEIEEK